MGDVAQENEEALQARARQRIEQAQLPREKPARMWGGRGTGLACNLCDAPILESEPEMELEYEVGARQPTVRFHLRCQTLWDVARQVVSPSQWISLEHQMPPLHTVVEARISLGSARSLILNGMRICDGETGPVVWLNATTNGQLPEHWHPVEWRGVPAPTVSSPSSEPGLTRRAYAQIGINLVHQSAAQATQGTAVAFWSEPILPGDLVFMETRGNDVISHVGIAIDGDTWIQARRPGDVVRVGPMPAKTSIVAVRRFVASG